MDFEEIVEKRRSIRKFAPKDVHIEMIKKIIDIGHMAPSAGNLQARDFILIRKNNIKEELVQCALGQSFIGEAPWVIVVCANKARSAKKYGERGRELYSVQDATAAVENMLLAITGQGLGSVWVGAFDESKVSELLSIPEGVRPVAILPIGYPDSKPSKPRKIETEELIHEEGW